MPPAIISRNMATMAKNLDILQPALAATDLKYEIECRGAIEPFLDELFDRAEAAGWQRKQAAMAIMYLAARRTK